MTSNVNHCCGFIGYYQCFGVVIRPNWYACSYVYDLSIGITAILFFQRHYVLLNCIHVGICYGRACARALPLMVFLCPLKLDNILEFHQFDLFSIDIAEF